MSMNDPLYDPKRDNVDPNRIYERDFEREAAGFSSWGWLLGGLAVVILVVMAISTGRNTETAGVAPGDPATISRSAAPTLPAPPSTTGQGSQMGSPTIQGNAPAANPPAVTPAPAPSNNTAQ